MYDCEKSISEEIQILTNLKWLLELSDKLGAKIG